jgi:8-oxo-dGTP pyrophosphatase MutT (NUDIX family)
MDIKSLFGLQSKAEKIQKYRDNLRQLHLLDKEIDQLGENFSLQKAQLNDLSNGDVELFEKAQNRFNAFLKQQSQDLQNVYKRKTKIEKSLASLEEDLEIADVLKDIKTLDSMRQSWMKGLIKKSIYIDLLKAKQGGKVRYADILVWRGSKLLILQRAGESGSYSEDWCVPGGHVDAGEDFRTAARRELFEETGIDTDDNLLTEVGVYDNGDVEIHYFMTYLDEFSPSLIVVDGFEEIGSAWIDPATEIDDYKFIFDMKDNIKKILGLPVEDVEVKAKAPIFTEVMDLAKSMVEGKISEKIFKAFCEKHKEEISKAGNKNYFSHKERKDLAKKGEAMPNGKYPIRNSQDLKDAIKLVGASDMPESEVKAWIRKRAKALGLENELPESWGKVEKAEGVEDAQTLSRESLDGKTKGPQGSGIGDENIEKSSLEKAISFKKEVYEHVVKEVEDDASKYSYGQFLINFSDNDGDHANKLGDFLGTLQKVTGLNKPFSIILKTKDNGEQEWNWKGSLRLNGVTKTENIQKSQENDLLKSNENDLTIRFNNQDDLQMFKSVVQDWNNEGKINIQSISGDDKNELEKAEKQEKKVFNEYLNFIEGAKTRLKNIHWGEEDNSKHVYLDDLSEEVGEFEDKIAEAGQAGFGRFKDGEIQGDKVEEDDPVKICQMIFDRTIEFRKELEGKDEYNGEISWIDDFLASLKQSKYRLQMH